MKRALLILLLISVAYADDPPDNRPPDNRPPDRGQDVDVNVRTPVNVEIDAPVDVSVDTPVNVNTQMTISRSMQRQTPNAYFNYTPNFLQCGRVLGFQYGNPSGIGSIGIPLPRDKACDVWLAVNEAQENGHILLSYAFMCEIKNIKKVWGKDRCQAITDTAGTWWIAMAQGDKETVTKTISRFEPPDSVVIATEQHDELAKELRTVQYELQQERKSNQQAQQQVQQQIEQYQEKEAKKQVSLDEFLKELETRAEK